LNGGGSTKVKIVMDSGREYVVEPKSRVADIDQFIWLYFEKNNNLINKLIKVDFDGEQLAINPTHISSLELLNN
jgi:uncharacterized protein YlzI (FlbEa/FlbD family)